MSWSEVKKINSNLGKPLDTLITEKADEVKTATASQTSINTVTTSIGATNNTGGTATAGSIFAKLNKLLTDWTTSRAEKIDTIATDVGTVKSNVATLIGGRVIKSIQRGVITGTTAASRVVPISAVDVNKSLVLVDGDVSSTDPVIGSIILGFTSTSITISTSRATTGEVSSTSRQSWQVIEFY